jgi:hypothetical protein
MRASDSRWHPVAVVIIAGISLSLVVWIVSTLVIERWIARRQRPSLLERLQPCQPLSVADEAQRWLEEQQG